MTMTKHTLVKDIAAITGHSAAVVRAVLDAQTEVVIREVSQGEAVRLGFGKVEPRVRAARNRRNPRNGETIAFPAYIAVVLEPSTAFTYALAQRE